MSQLIRQNWTQIIVGYMFCFGGFSHSVEIYILQVTWIFFQALID